MTQAMNAEERPAGTKGDLRRLRDNGKVPGVVYGGKASGPTLIAVEEKELLALLRQHSNAVLELNLPEGSKPVLVSDVQRDPVTRSVLHIDFREIDMQSSVRTQVRLEPAGEAPGEKAGGMLQQLLHELEIECLPADIPDVISVDVSRLDLGGSLTVADLALPPGVKLRTDPELVVATVLVPRKDDAGEADEPGGEERKDAHNGISGTGEAEETAGKR